MMPDYYGFQRELEGLINKYSLEQRSNTPDFILAAYLCECLNAYEHLALMRAGWYGEPRALSTHAPGPQGVGLIVTHPSTGAPETGMPWQQGETGWERPG